MDFVKKNKNILMVAGVIVLGLLAYWYWQGSGSVGGPTLVASDSNPASLAGQDILSMLNELRSIKIDASVFDSPAYKSLVDYRIATSGEPIGRPDPFAPLPFELQKK